MNDKKRVLIVDDNPLDRKLLSSAVGALAVLEPVECESGEAALELLRKGEFSAVLLDILLPGLSGIQTLQLIREQSGVLELPVLMVSTVTDADRIIEAIGMGANDYITKPIHVKLAAARLSLHLALSQESEDHSLLKEMSAIQSLVATYNHEINNPLAIAIGNLELLRSGPTSERDIDKALQALWRISEIVKRIQSVMTQTKPQFNIYNTATKLYKVR